MNDLVNAISTLGFPVFSCIALFFGCKYMLDNNNKHIEKMFDMYDKANTENRQAIEACTKAIDKLCNTLDERG